MAIRNDFTIDWSTNPRVITIDAPSTSCSMQDLFDTLRWLEAKSSAMEDGSIVDASGKEPLDSAGTKVGITVSLLNATVGFEARLDWTQCVLDGGNLVAYDIDGVIVDPINPTAYVNITRTSSSSATLQEQDALQYSSYGGVVSIDPLTTNPNAKGVLYPSGNKEYPVDNIPNGVYIAWDKGIDTLELRGNHELVLGDEPTKLKLRGQNKILTILNVHADANVLQCEFSRMTIMGTLDGDSIIEKCSIKGLNYVNGEVIQSTLQEEEIILGGNKEARFIDCYSGVSGSNTPTLNMNGTGQSLLIRNYSGGIKITNREGSDPCSIDMNSGHVIIDATCTGSAITVRGTCKVTVMNGATLPNLEGKSLMVQDEVASQVFTLFKTTDI